MCCLPPLQVLQQASPAHLTSLTAVLDRLGPQYSYDVDYLNGFIRWKVHDVSVISLCPCHVDC